MAGSATEDLAATAPLTDDELCAAALAADPDTAADADAACFWDVIDSRPAHVLPDWYMPAPMGGTRALIGWRGQLVRLNVALIVASFLAINAYGLCNTYGQLHP